MAIIDTPSHTRSRNFWMKDSVVYLLVNDRTKHCYLGWSNDHKNRLRKHNREIKGGARTTTKRYWVDGELVHVKWRHYCIVSNLTKKEAMSLERIVKNKRPRGKGKRPVDKWMSILVPEAKKKTGSKLVIHID